MSTINPKHYDIVVNGHKIEVVDLMEARFAEDAHLSQALKYLLRAGHKTDSSYIKDVSKCLWWCARALMFHKVTHIELPPGAPIIKVKQARKRTIKKHPGDEMMNGELIQFTRTDLKDGLAQCTDKQQLMFKRMYARGDLDKPINDVIDDMPADKLDRAMTQVQRTLDMK